MCRFFQIYKCVNPFVPPFSFRIHSDFRFQYIKVQSQPSESVSLSVIGRDYSLYSNIYISTISNELCRCYHQRRTDVFRLSTIFSVVHFAKVSKIEIYLL